MSSSVGGGEETDVVSIRDDSLSQLCILTVTLQQFMSNSQVVKTALLFVGALLQLRMYLVKCTRLCGVSFCFHIRSTNLLGSLELLRHLSQNIKD